MSRNIWNPIDTVYHLPFRMAFRRGPWAQRKHYEASDEDRVDIGSVLAEGGDGERASDRAQKEESEPNFRTRSMNLPNEKGRETGAPSEGGKERRKEGRGAPRPSNNTAPEPAPVPRKPDRKGLLFTPPLQPSAHSHFTTVTTCVLSRFHSISAVRLLIWRGKC
ncbi:hypothetical protein MPTK1_2g16480 [Marchantia polymorpha subsp. ruderalis]|uniref:Uncharacterized protein n=1 Tax=Marchantia polymorpha TaxID=3197 RepID=A0A2R6W9P7_MARPO|nr:hypothetical protein MARPO_0122s0016 [Marchantia polymorpha]BBN02586.1 hypothetical protein Mp_2g16480 [Marchantia polymorpha subsp. ruderalis]|eukprot:PTQ30583.1 hypothetical protein MARPO_0122s0016 [Marchantia polymorpha]